MQDTKRQLDELYDLRDALIDTSSRGSRPAVSQSVRNQLISRLNELKGKITDDHRAEGEAADGFYNEQE